MIRWFAVASLVAATLLPSAPAMAACRVVQAVNIPVTMMGDRAIVTARINGHDARFILDSGAFFSTLSPAAAQEFGLRIDSLGGAELHGIGGHTALNATTVKAFVIAGQTVPNVQFAVGGSDMGFSGLIGQNILGVADVEYDLPHGMVRLLKTEGCGGANMAYWAGTKPASMLEIEPMGQGQSHTIGTVKVNGTSVRAGFDTGAFGALLMLPAAKRAGLGPDTPGVTADGFAAGLGQNRARQWRGHASVIDIGGELINKPLVRIIDQTLQDTEALIGIDFFLSHRVYVDNRSHRMFFTYEGGPVFGLDPKGAFDAHGAALDLTDKAAEPTDAAGFSRRGAILATAGKYDEAIADFDKAVAMAPDEPQFLVQRGLAHLSNRQPLLGAADLDKAIERAPGNSDARLARAQLRMSARDPAGALADLKAADAALAPSSDARMRLAAAYTAAGEYAPAVASLDLWLKSHTEDHARATAFNERCWARALANQDLDKALADCEAALRLHVGQPEYLDSRALVRFRRGEFDKAIADYDAVVAAQPHNAWSLYARGITERRAGKIADADRDRANALAIDPRVAERAKRYGLE